MSLPLIMGAVKSAMTVIGSAGPAIQAALSVGTVATQYLSAKGMEAANAEANDQERQYMIADYDQMTRMADQEIASATQRQGQIEQETAQAVAQARVASSAGGVQGLSVDALLNDMYGQGAAAHDAVNQNLENTGHQMAAEREGIYRRGSAAIASRPESGTTSLFGSAMEAGMGIYGAYKDTLKVKSKL